MKNMLKIPLAFITTVMAIFLSTCTEKDHINPIIDTDWEVYSITSPDKKYIIISPTPYEVNFQKDNVLTMRLDVNSCGGTYSVDNSTSMNIDPMYCTEICCDKPFADTLLNILPKINSYRITGDDLELISSNRIINLTKITKEN